MSKSTRMTKTQLSALGLEEVEPGVYGPKRKPANEMRATPYLKAEYPVFAHARGEKENVYVGIDPGKSGAIAFVDYQGTLHKWVIPVIGKDIDGNELYRIINDISTKYRPTFVIEDVHSVFGAGAGSNFQFGFVCGFIRAMVIANGCPYHMVQPKSWQKIIWSNDDKVYKPKKPEQKRPQLDTKATSLKAAVRMYPNFDMRKSERSKIPHDGIVDAVLLATYGRRINL